MHSYCLLSNSLENLYVGLDNDTSRCTRFPPRTGRDNSTGNAFGSYHPSGLNVAFCDGSVRVIEYAIHPNIWRSMGNKEGE
ncbi:MAG: DUF1559 domain-containing protein [Nitrososphaera sp.]